MTIGYFVLILIAIWVFRCWVLFIKAIVEYDPDTDGESNKFIDNRIGVFAAGTVYLMGWLFAAFIAILLVFLIVMIFSNWNTVIF